MVLLCKKFDWLCLKCSSFGYWNIVSLLQMLLRKIFPLIYEPFGFYILHNIKIDGKFKSFLWLSFLSLHCCYDVLKFYINGHRAHFLILMKKKKNIAMEFLISSSNILNLYFLIPVNYIVSKMFLKISIHLQRCFKGRTPKWQSVTCANHIKLRGNITINMSYKKFDLFYIAVAWLTIAEAL